MLKQELAKQFGKYIADGKDRFEEKTIKDYPVLITDDNWVVCIPASQEESFTCGCVGMSKMGKTLVLHRLSEGLFFAGKNVAILNDSLNETFDWSLKQDNPQFIQEISLLKQNPVPLPIVYVFPNTSSLKIDEVKEKICNHCKKTYEGDRCPKCSSNEFAEGRCYIKLKNGNEIEDYLKITIPFPQILNNINSFITSINPEFELGQSSMYIKKMPELYSCQTEEDVIETIKKESLQNIEFQKMEYKILSAFETLFSEKIADISSEDAPSTLSYGDFKENPFSVLMNGEAIPSFMTSDLYNKKYRAEIFAYHINLIFDNQTKPEFKNSETYLVFDELTKVCSTEDKNVAEKALANLVARGRHFRLGLLFAVQAYEKISSTIRNARFDYLFAFQLKNHDAINTIIKDFDLSKDIGKEIKELKPLECIGITHQKFICYRNGETKEVSEPIKGRIIPPLSKHRKTG